MYIGANKLKIFFSNHKNCFKIFKHGVHDLFYLELFYVSMALTVLLFVFHELCNAKHSFVKRHKFQQIMRHKLRWFRFHDSGNVNL